jgi:nitrogen fixation/metabolism regulation signal transduction histidine kinase
MLTPPPCPSKPLGSARRKLNRSGKTALIAAHSLRALLLRYALIYLGLIVFSSALGGAGFYFWRQSSAESLRLNAMVSDMQLMRGALYRQLKEIFDAVFLDDAAASTQYREYANTIEAHFAELQRSAASAQERAAIDRLHGAYREVQRQGAQVLAAAPLAADPVKRQALDEKLEQGALREYERAFRAAESFLRTQQARLNARLRTLTWLALLLLALPLLSAFSMLLLSRRFMRTAFVAPVSDLMQATARIRQGNLDHRVAPAGAAELRQLAESVNRMAADLAHSRAALLQAERQAALGALVPVLAHNIRNPLASIRAAAQVMDEPGASAQLREGLRDIIRTTDRLERWTHALLSYLHPLEPRAERADLTAVADSALALLEAQLQRARVQVRRVDWERGAPALFDAQLVEQALHGLLTNAIEASPPGAVITLRPAAPPSQVMMTIIDQGAGMPFMPTGSELKPGPTTKLHGSGLGIPFALKVCEVHGGSLQFGAAPGGGTQVTLMLPRHTGTLD